MRILIPFTEIHPDTLRGAPDDAVWAYVGRDDDAYWRLLCEFWAYGDDFTVIEHDVVCRPDIIASFEACPEPWCAYKYQNICHDACMEAWANMLGCTRFRAELLATVPDAVVSVPEDQRDWHNLCDAIAGNKVGGMPAPLRPGSVRAAGFSHHWHGSVVHHQMGRNDVVFT